jgi:hypothetical protein
VLVTDDSDRAQTFHPDGKKHDEKDANGKKVSTKTEWQGAALVAETKLSHSSKLTQTFRLSDDGKQLYVTSRLENPSLQGAVSIQRVYDLLGSSAREGSSHDAARSRDGPHELPHDHAIRNHFRDENRLLYDLAAKPTLEFCHG